MKLDIVLDEKTRSGPVVVIDDEELDIEAVERALAKSRLDRPLLKFSDGPPFIDHLQRIKAGDEPYPMLVLLDINMPEMSGFDVLRRMRGDDMFRNIPIVSMLTSSTHDRDRQEALDCGANAYLVKPANYNDYVALFDQLAD